VAKFKDSTGHEWAPLLNVTLAREIRQTCEIDLLTLAGSGSAFHRMETDRGLLASVLWVTCCDEAAALGVDEAEFGRRLSGDVFNAAVKATRQAVVDFLAVPDHQLREPGQPPDPPVGKTAPPQHYVSGPMRSEFSTHIEDQRGYVSG
jgi:hypothetical protein